MLINTIFLESGYQRFLEVFTKFEPSVKRGYARCGYEQCMNLMGEKAEAEGT